MADREKVIKGLECCTFILGKRKCNECPYQPDNGCYQLQDDFHAMLKEQEAVEPYSINAEKTYGLCPKCGKLVFRYGNVEENRYCGICGQAVKWNA